jgi:thiol:disulfide interchange protein DsbD
VSLFKGAQILTYDFVLGLYVALAVLCGLYLLKLYRLPHDEESTEPIGVPRLLLSLFFVGLGLYLMPALFKTEADEPQRPQGRVFGWLDAFLLRDKPPASTEVAAKGNLTKTGMRPGPIRLVWNRDFQKALKEAEEQRKLIFLNFTGVV